MGANGGLRIQAGAATAPSWRPYAHLSSRAGYFRTLRPSASASGRGRLPLDRPRPRFPATTPAPLRGPPGDVLGSVRRCARPCSSPTTRPRPVHPADRATHRGRTPPSPGSASASSAGAASRRSLQGRPQAITHPSPRPEQPAPHCFTTSAWGWEWPISCALSALPFPFGAFALQTSHPAKASDCLIASNLATNLDVMQCFLT